MAKRSSGFRKTRKFERGRKRAAKTQKTSVLIFGEDKACRELCKAILNFRTLKKDYHLSYSFGGGRSPVDVVKDAYLYRDNGFDKIIVIMDSDFIDYGDLNISQIIDKACKDIPGKRMLAKAPHKTDIKVFAVTPNCSECFLLKLTKQGKVSTRKCSDCKDTCKLKKIDSNDHLKYISMVDSDHFNYMCKQSDFKWLGDLIDEITEEPSE